jgi:hypothetical protein
VRNRDAWLRHRLRTMSFGVRDKTRNFCAHQLGLQRLKHCLSRLRDCYHGNRANAAASCMRLRNGPHHQDSSSGMMILTEKENEDETP